MRVLAAIVPVEIAADEVGARSPRGNREYNFSIVFLRVQIYVVVRDEDRGGGVERAARSVLENGNTIRLGSAVVPAANGDSAGCADRLAGTIRRIGTRSSAVVVTPHSIWIAAARKAGHEVVNGAGRGGCNRTHQ